MVFIAFFQDKPEYFLKNQEKLAEVTNETTIEVIWPEMSGGGSDDDKDDDDDNDNVSATTK